MGAFIVPNHPNRGWRRHMREHAIAYTLGRLPDGLAVLLTREQVQQIVHAAFEAGYECRHQRGAIEPKK